MKKYKTAEPFITVRRQICLSVAIYRQSDLRGKIMKHQGGLQLFFRCDVAPSKSSKQDLQLCTGRNVKTLNTDFPRPTALNGHLSCRSSRQYIKPTLTGHLSCRSCRQYIKPTLAPPVDRLFYRHSLQSKNSPHTSYCFNIYFYIFPSSKANKKGHFFQIP